MSSLTTHFSFYLPADGDGDENGMVWFDQVNQNFVDIDALLAARMVNPMTAPGDLIVGGTGGAPTRLGIGDETQVLVREGGTLQWVTIDLSGWGS